MASRRYRLSVGVTTLGRCWRPPPRLHHFVSHSAKEEGIGLGKVLGRVTMQVFVRDHYSMIAAPVQCDVDGIPKGSLTEWIEKGGTKEALIELIKNTPEWKPEVIAGADVPDAISGFIKRFVVLSENQLAVLSLWVAHTHAIESTDVTPYLAVTSAEKQSGKSRLLEELNLIVANPWYTGRVTAAVLVRKVDGKHPTLLLDESDAAFGGEKEYAEALRGVLNTGHCRGGVASLCVGQGAEISYKDFSTFCPKAIAVSASSPTRSRIAPSRSG